MNRRTFLKSLAALPLVPLAPAATAEVVRRHTYKVTTANPCLAHSPPRYRVMVYAWGRFVHEYDFVARWEGLNVLQIPHPATKIQVVARGPRQIGVHDLALHGGPVSVVGFYVSEGRLQHLVEYRR